MKKYHFVKSSTSIFVSSSTGFFSIFYLSKLTKNSVSEILSRLKDAGLQSVPGAGAEILTDSVKEIISPKKIDSDDWLRIMREAFELGLPASATMMYGHVETDNDIVEHYDKIAKLLIENLTTEFDISRKWASENYSILKKRLAEDKVAGVIEN